MASQGERFGFFDQLRGGYGRGRLVDERSREAEASFRQERELARAALFLHVQPRIYTTATRPAAGSTLAGVVIYVRDASSPATLQACMQNTDDSWSWVIVTPAAF